MYMYSRVACAGVGDSRGQGPRKLDCPAEAAHEARPIRGL